MPPHIFTFICARTQACLGGISLAFTLLLTSCSNGGVAQLNTPVVGFVSKAPVTGATCHLYNTANQVVGTVNTSSTGAIDFGTTTQTGPVYAQCTGGSYLDEATGQTVTNTGVLTSGAVIATSGEKVNIVISPLTQLAYLRAGGGATGFDPAKMITEAANIAKVFGLGDVDILKTIPTDTNTKAASTDAAGRYGVMLAAIAQNMKDNSATLQATLTTFQSAINTDGTMNAATAAALQASVNNLSDPTKNSNPAVQANAGQTAQILMNTGAGTGDGVTGTAGTADTTPFASKMVFSDSSNAIVTRLLTANTYTVTVTGGNLANATLAATEMTCTTPVISNSNKTLTANCATSNAASTATLAVQVAGKTIAGLQPSVSYSFNSAIASMSPTSAAYASQTSVFTVTGNALNPAASATLAGASCAAASGNSATNLTFTCYITNVRTVTRGDFVVTGYDASAPHLSKTTAITYTAPAASLTAVSPSSMTQGASGASNYTLTGTGLYAGMPVNLGGTLCKGRGIVNSTATSLIGVDCSNAVVSSTDTATTIAVANPATNATSQAITLTAKEASISTPILAFSGNVTSVQLGANSAITALASSASKGAIIYASSNSAVASIDASSGVITPLAVGTTTITANQAAVPGLYASATSSYVLTVTAQTAPVLTFAQSSKTATLGDADFINAASATCSTEGPRYAPTVSYSVTSGAAIVTVDSAGKAVLKGAGTATIAASIAASGTCAAQTSSYTLTINKATPLVSFSNPITSGTFGGAAITNVATVTTPPNSGSGTMPTTVNLVLAYSSTSPEIVTVSSAGVVTMVGAGSSSISAAVAGDANYNPVPPIRTYYNFTVGKAASTLTVGNATLSLTTGAAATANAATLTGVSGAIAPTGGITYSSSNTAVATVATDGKVTPVAVGSANVTASYAGDTNYRGAIDVTTTVTVALPRYIKISSTGAELPDSATSWCAVKDKTTGYYWQNHQTSTEAAKRFTNESTASANNALGYANAQNAASLCGFTDWRLPTGNTGDVATGSADGGELKTLVVGTTGPTIDTTYFQNAQSGQYWTSTGRAGVPTNAWFINFYNSIVSNLDRSNTYSVRLMRFQKYTKISNTGLELPASATSWCAVKDITTGLYWQNQYETGLMAGPGQTFTNETTAFPTNALGYVAAQNLASLCGFTDWRLPAASSFGDGTGELDGLSAAYRSSAANAAYFQNVQTSGLYWAASTSPLDPNYAPCVGFLYGGVSFGSRTYPRYVRLVRSSP